jgi:hypothetical protein
VRSWELPTSPRAEEHSLLEDVPNSKVKIVTGTASLSVAVICKMYKALYYKLEGRGFETNEVNFFNVPNPSGRTRPWVHSAPNRNEYQKWKDNVSGE